MLHNAADKRERSDWPGILAEILAIVGPLWLLAPMNTTLCATTPPGTLVRSHSATGPFHERLEAVQ